MPIIALTQGKEALVDEEDFEYLSKQKWHVSGKKYAGASVNGQEVTMHRIVAARMGLDCSYFITHLDGNRFNNQRSNLRIATMKQATQAQRLKSNNKTGVKGVSFIKKTQKYFASIFVDNKTLYLGVFDTLAEATEAYREAAENFFGEYART